MKKILACLCAAALSVGVAACGNQTTTVDTTYPNTTLTGQVQEVTESTVTLLLGELTTQEGPGQSGGGQHPPDLPQGETPPANPEETADGDAAPTESDSEASGPQHKKPDKKPDGSSPEKPDGEKPAAPPNREVGDTTDTAAEAAQLTETAAETSPGEAGSPTLPDGEAPDSDQMDLLFEMGSLTTFTAGEETVTLSVSDDLLETLSTVQTGDVIQVETDENGVAVTLTVIDLNADLSGSPGGGAGTVEQGTAAYTLAADGSYSDESYTSDGDDENALRVDGVTVDLDGITVEKSGGICSNVESGDFYGMNAALLATNGAVVNLTGAHVTSNAQNGNGVFSYGEGTVVNIADSVIETAADNSGGIQTTGGGTTNASNLTVTTQGSSSAAIRSDRGGGTVNAAGGTYTTNGLNSPAVYSTANISVSSAVLTANDSEALVIEGQNSITLTDCDVSGNMNKTRGSSSDVNVHNVMIYQSMSGDAEVGTASFTMTGGSLTGNSGDLIYVTNTRSVIELCGVELVNNDPDGALLRVAGNDASHGWGTAGANGASVTLTARDQVLAGDIIVDDISTLDLTLSEGSAFTGTIQIVDNAEGGAAVENNAAVTIEKGSSWTLTGNCVITTLDNQGTIHFNGYTITLADGTVLSE